MRATRDDLVPAPARCTRDPARKFAAARGQDSDPTGNRPGLSDDGEGTSRHATAPMWSGDQARGPTRTETGRPRADGARSGRPAAVAAGAAARHPRADRAAPFVGRAARAAADARSLGGRRASRAASWCWPASRGSARRGWRRGSPPGARRRAASCSTAAPTRRASRPYQPFVEALRHYAAHRPGLAEETRLPAAAARELARLVPELGLGRAAAVIDRERRRPSDRATSSSTPSPGSCCTPPGAAAPARARGPALGRRADAAVAARARAPQRRIARAGRRDLQRPRGGRVGPAGARAGGPAARDARGHDPPGRLRPAETAGLVAAHRGRGQTTTALAQRLHEETGGNPFFIEELLHTPPRADAAGVPQGVKDVIGRRLDRLPAATLEALDAGGRAGQRLPPGRAAGGRSRADAGRADRGARGRRGGTADPRGSRGGRPLLVRARARARDAVRAADRQPPRAPAPAASRWRSRRRRCRCTPAELAHHYFQAREVGGAAKAIVYSLRAGQAPQEAHAYEDAAKHYERALARCWRSSAATTTPRAATCSWRSAPRAGRPASPTRARRSWRPSSWPAACRPPSGSRWPCSARAVASTRPGPPTTATSSCSRRPSTALGPGDSVLRVRVLARLAEKLVFAEPPERAVELADEAVAMARRLGEPEALAAALMGRHAARLYAGHAPERHRIGEQALALAEELEQRELAALARHWRSTTSPSWASSTRRGAGTARSSRSPRSSSSRSTGTRRWPGAASGRHSTAGSARPSGSRRRRCGWPSTPGRPTPARRSPRSSSPSGASRAACTTCCRRSSGWPATSRRPPPGAAWPRSPIWTPATTRRPGPPMTACRSAACRARCCGSRRPPRWPRRPRCSATPRARRAVRRARAARRPLRPVGLHRQRRLGAPAARPHRRHGGPGAGRGRPLRRGPGAALRGGRRGARRTHAL